jgi:hypothetical protein
VQVASLIDYAHGIPALSRSELPSLQAEIRVNVTSASWLPHRVRLTLGWVFFYSVHCIGDCSSQSDLASNSNILLKFGLTNRP